MHRFSSYSEAEAMQVLVVANDATIRQIIRTLLAKHRYEVIEAENGLQGWTFARQYSCDLVITDEIMPLMNGREMISHLAAERYAAMYLLISGYNQAVQSGVAFLRKPFTARQLTEVVKRLQHEPTLPELENAWQKAKDRWQEALTEFQAVISDVPSRIASPDGTLRIERAADKQRTTYKRFIEAFHNYKATLRGCGVLGLNYDNLEPEDLSE